MALKLASSFHLFACAIRTALGVVQKPIFSQFTPVPKVNKVMLAGKLPIFGSRCANEALTYKILPLWRMPLKMLAWETIRGCATESPVAEGHFPTCMPEEETPTKCFIAFNTVLVFSSSQDKSSPIPRGGRSPCKGNLCSVMEKNAPDLEGSGGNGSCFLSSVIGIQLSGLPAGLS